MVMRLQFKIKHRLTIAIALGRSCNFALVIRVGVILRTSGEEEALPVPPGKPKLPRTQASRDFLFFPATPLSPRQQFAPHCGIGIRSPSIP